MAEGDVIEIGLLLYPGAQMSAVLGMTDLFDLANRTARRKSRDTPPPTLRVCHWQAEQPGMPPARVFDTHPDASSVPAVFVVPPALGDPISPELAAPLAHWLRDRHGAGGVLASVCAGAFLLGETGLLAGRAVTTNWVYDDAFRLRFPRQSSIPTGWSSTMATSSPLAASWPGPTSASSSSTASSARR